MAGRTYFQPGEQLGRYRIERVVGSGGMAVVYRANQAGWDRTVALKVLDRQRSANPEDAERFRREARTLERLHHPSVVQVFDLEVIDEHLCIAMPFMEGGTLADHLERHGPLSPGEVAGIVEGIASALDATHAEQILHRDVKPANILLQDGTAMLSDFGIAKIADRTALTDTGNFIGSIDYASPEQISGADLSGASDRYALGVVAYECLTGSLPHEPGREAAIRRGARGVSIPPVTHPDGTVHEAISAVLRTALQKKPTDRWQSGAAFAAAFTQAAGVAASAPEAERRTVVAPLAPSRTPSGRTLSTLVGAAVAVIALVLLIAGPFGGGDDGAGTDIAAGATPEVEVTGEPAARTTPTPTPRSTPRPTATPAVTATPVVVSAPLSTLTLSPRVSPDGLTVKMPVAWQQIHLDKALPRDGEQQRFTTRFLSPRGGATIVVDRIEHPARTARANRAFLDAGFAKDEADNDYMRVAFGQVQLPSGEAFDWRYVVREGAGGLQQRYNVLFDMGGQSFAVRVSAGTDRSFDDMGVLARKVARTITVDGLDAGT